MTKTETQKQQESKAQYQSPLVVRVSLRPEEAVLGHCKVTGIAGPAGAGCRTPTACNSQGS
jgi:hypothetical protein